MTSELPSTTPSTTRCTIAATQFQTERSAPLTRRQMLLALGSAVMLFGCSSGAKDSGGSGAATATDVAQEAAVKPSPAGKATCELTRPLPQPASANDEALLRSDVRTEAVTSSVQPGQQIVLTIDLFESLTDACRPVDGARVEIWSAGFDGNYSADKATTGALSTFLRGHQLSEKGRVTFTTIFPGWTEKRAPHINVRVFTSSSDKKQIVLNTQLFFDDETIDAVYENSPYDKRAKGLEIRTKDDPMFKAGGQQIKVVREEQTLRGFATIGLDLNAKGASVTTVVATTVPELSGATNTLF